MFRRWRLPQIGCVYIALALWASLSLQVVAEDNPCNCTAIKPKGHQQRSENFDLKMARIYMALQNWNEAETHFVAAARDPDASSESLSGLEQARRNIDREKAQSDEALLNAAQIYHDNGLSEKAQELYQTLASDSGVREATRARARTGLAASLADQSGKRFLAKIRDQADKMESVLEAASWGFAFIAGLILAIAAVLAIRKRRSLAVIRDFAAPKDESAREVALNLRYARAMMGKPSFSPVGLMPAPLLERMFVVFEAELPPIENLELGGAKLPFAPLAELFGGPRVQITGGYDGASPSGLAFAEISTRRDGVVRFTKKEIRTGTPQERADNLDFAYDVLVTVFSV